MKELGVNPEFLTELSIYGPVPVRKKCCKRCSANHLPHDPESIDISNAVLRGEVSYLEVAYRCFNDHKMLCRGQYNLCHGKGQK